MEQVSTDIDISRPVEDTSNRVIYQPKNSHGTTSSSSTAHKMSEDNRRIQVEESPGDIDAITATLDPNYTDVNNPQNWPAWRKTTVFLALMTSSILCDGGMTWGASLFVAQAGLWDITVAKSSTSMNWGILLQGFGGVLAVPFMEYYGRYPVWMWSQILTLAAVIGATFSGDFNTFTAFRTLQGLFGTIPQVVGLPIIHDMYAPEDWPKMINIWGTTFIVGPFLGPALAGYLADAMDWHDAFAVLVCLYAISTILVVAFGKETYYAPNRGSAPAPTFIQSITSRGGALALYRPSFKLSSKITLKYIFVWPMLLCGISMMVNFTWPIGITTTVDTFIRAPPFLMNNVQAASMRFSAVFGAIGGFIIGYIFNEYISKTRTPLPSWRPEFRLFAVFIPAIFECAGLILFGLGNQFELSWVALAFGWFMVNIGLVGTMVAITAYVLEKYPAHATTVSAIMNMWRSCGGFSVSYYQAAWVAASGVGVVFGIQAAIVAFFICAMVIPVIIFGKNAPGALVDEME